MSDEERPYRSKDDGDGGGSRKPWKSKDHSGSVRAADPALAEWLLHLWARQEHPSYAELYQALGSFGDRRGTRLVRWDFGSNEKLDAEQCAILSNVVRTTAQSDCDRCERKMMYRLDVYDLHRDSEPTTYRFKLSVQRPVFDGGPNGESHGGDSDDEDGEDLRGMPMSFRWNRDLAKQNQWLSTQLFRALGDLVVSQQAQNANLQAHNEKLMNQTLAMHGQLTEALDHAEDRVIAREWTKFKIEIARDGYRMGRNLLPAAIAKIGDGKEQQQLPANGANGANGKTVDPDPNAPFIRTLLENFLADVENSGKSKAIFGEFTEDGKPIPDKPGVFTWEQLKLFLRVKLGDVPVAAIDALLPTSGQPQAITPAQFAQAFSLLTDGTLTSLKEVLSLRGVSLESMIAAMQQQQPAPPKEGAK